MSHNQPVEDVFGKNVENCNVAELKQWLAKHRMIAGDQRLRVSGNKKELAARQERS